jgi:phosphoglycerate dehydrogenase-like enzyme
MPADVEGGAVFVQCADDLLAQADFLVLAANPTPGTRGFLNRERIARMKPSAAVINIARGDFVDDDALIEALRDGRLAGAGLDVYNNEPAFDPRYRDLPNAFIMPHIGSSTVEARRRMGRVLVEGLQTMIAGRQPINRLV